MRQRHRRQKGGTKKTESEPSEIDNIQSLFDPKKSIKENVQIEFADALSRMLAWFCRCL